MDTEKIITDLEKIIVTNASYNFETGEIDCEVSTLKEHLANTCEQSELVNCSQLKEKLLDFGDCCDYDRDMELKDDHIYCFSVYGVYNLGKTFTSAKREMLDYGYVSQLSNTQYCGGDDYWETVEGENNFTKFDENDLIFS
ncbi:hypothetical protein AB9M75_04195 [Lactobacillus sp. AN1001]